MPRISYRAIAMRASAKLCVGDKLEIDVAIKKTAVINGNTYSEWVTGGLLEAVIKKRQVGRFDPPRDPMQAQIDASVANFATFTFLAAAPGETEIDFNIKRSGEEARGIPIRPAPGGVPAASFVTTIEVTDCYDAYTSGLATTFTEKNMGRLTEFSSSPATRPMPKCGPCPSSSCSSRTHRTRPPVRTRSSTSGGRPARRERGARPTSAAATTSCSTARSCPSG